MGVTISAGQVEGVIEICMGTKTCMRVAAGLARH